MPKVCSPFTVQRRSKKNKSFILTLNPTSGLSPETCKDWRRRSFTNFPPELSAFSRPTSLSVAKSGANALIQYLIRKESEKPAAAAHVPDKDLSVGAWLERFISLGNNPRAARLIGDASPYSPATIELYRQHFGKHVKGDPFLDMKMVDVEESHALAFTARLGIRKTKDGRELAGTRTFEVVVAFVRMAFHEYWEEHQHWINPFDRIKAPKRYKGRRRDVLQESEILKLFMPGVITDVLEYAVCTAMFWVGLRRAEIFGLKTSDLDWKTPQIRIDHAWKLFGKKKNRTLGDPKWHKHREAPFPEELQAAIKKLQEVNGVHDFVFCYKDGGTPHGKWILEKMPKWMKAAGVDPAGRKIVPHSARHSLASTLEAAGVPLRYIQEMLGHASMKTTKVYLHTPEGKINELTKKISDLSKAEEEKKEAGEVLKISEYR